MANPSSPRIREAMRDGALGFIATPEQGNKLVPGAVWCADNGCFSEKFNVGKWWRFLEQNAHDASTCLFAVAPDAVGDHQRSYRRSDLWLDPIRELGYPVAWVAQDGATMRRGSVPWDRFDVLFLGGSTEWKLGMTARTLVAEAKARGKRVHAGRVNSQRRFSYMRFIGCDSADGTILAKWPDTRFADVMSWVRSTNQGHLFGQAS